MTTRDGDETRPTKDELMMGIAVLAARRSTCLRKQVGCVLTDERHEQVALGYNGTCRGAPDGCLIPEADGACGCVHAETNACVKARFVPTRAYVTLGPCELCAQLLVNAGVREVHIKTGHSSSAGVVLLKDAGVRVVWTGCDEPHDS